MSAGKTHADISSLHVTNQGTASSPERKLVEVVPPRRIQAYEIDWHASSQLFIGFAAAAEWQQIGLYQATEQVG